MGTQKVGLDWATEHTYVSQGTTFKQWLILHVTCNGFSLVSKWNWRWKACQYILKKFSCLSNMFWGSLTWNGLFWMGQSVSSVTQWCLTLCNPMDWSTPGFPVHYQLPDATETVMPSSHLILCRPLLLPPSIFPSIRVFSNKLVLHIRWPNYWSFHLSISPSNEYSGLIDCL